MGVWVEDKPRRIKGLRGEVRASNVRCPTERTPKESEFELNKNRETKLINDKLNSITLSELIIRIVIKFPGIRLRIIEAICMRSGKRIGYGSVSAELPKLVKQGKLNRVKDGDSFRYFTLKP